jgi:glycosyltransferase involved in cell wall biosynthesis
MADPIRVLILADDCNPEWPSLPVVGFNSCRAIADVAETVVVTQVRNRPNIEKVGMGRAQVVYVDNEYVAAPVHRLAIWLRGGDKVAWTTNVAMTYPSYIAFEREVWRRFRRELRAGQFDIVHRLTPMSPTLPSPMAAWSPVPFVLGPLNGGLPWPPEYMGEQKRERERLSNVRSAHRVLPYYRSTYSRSTVLAAFQHTIDDLPPMARRRAIDFPEVGFDPATFHPPKSRPATDALTFLFVGRLVPYKCSDVVVEAFAKTPELRRHKLRIVGDGPDKPALEQIIRDHNLQSQVELVGWKSQAGVADEMRNADVFAFPSIRELGAGVVVEAMACGLPSIVVDYGGPGGLVRNGTGIRVPLQSKLMMISAFGQAMARLGADPAATRRMGEAASDYVFREYTWDKKAGKFLEVYEWVLGRRRARPAFLGQPVHCKALVQ